MSVPASFCVAAERLVLLPVSSSSGHISYRADKTLDQDRTSQWNTVVFHLPKPLIVDNNLCISAKGHIESATQPDYLGVQIINDRNEVSFVSMALTDGNRYEFSVSAARLKPQGRHESRSTSSSPLGFIDRVSLYARFSDTVASKLVIDQVVVEALQFGKECEHRTPANLDLLQGSFELLDSWRGVHPRLYRSGAEFDKLSLAWQRNPTPFAHALPDDRHLSGAPRPLDEGQSAQGSAMAIARLAVAYRLTRDPRYLKRLQEWVPIWNAFQPPAMDNIGSVMGLTAGHVLIGFALAYDVLYGVVDKETQTALRGVLIRQGERTFSDLAKLPNYPYEQNHLIIPVSGLALASLALGDEDESHVRWGIFATNVLSRSLTSMSHDGWFFEGWSYWDYTMQFPAAYAAAAKRLQGKDVFGAPPFKGMAQYVAHMTLPNPDFVFDFGDWGPRVEPDGIGFQKGYDQPWHTLPSRSRPFVLFLAWKEGGRDPLLANHLRRLLKEGRYAYTLSDIDACFWMLLGMGDALPALPQQEAGTSPPYHYFSDMDVLHWRSQWGDPFATALAFKSGPPAGHSFVEHLRRNPGSRPSLGHAHPDAGSFLLYSRGVFLANDTGYTGSKRTADHNAILIDGVGQGVEGTSWATFTDRPYVAYDAVRLENVWMGPRVAAATATYQDAYSPKLGMQKVVRHLILVDGRFMVIVDELESTQVHQYSWRVHTDQAPVPMGTGRFTMTNGPAKLTVMPLAGASSHSVAPTVVETELFDRRRSRPQQRGFHLEVRSPRLSSHRFLTALVITDATSLDESVSAHLADDGSITLTDDQGSCTIRVGALVQAAEPFAYELRGLNGRILANERLSGDWSRRPSTPAAHDDTLH